MPAEKWRVGRSLGRTLYIQVGEEPSKDDQCIGMVDTREIAGRIVTAMNEAERLREDRAVSFMQVLGWKRRTEQAEELIETVRALAQQWVDEEPANVSESAVRLIFAEAGRKILAELPDPVIASGQED
jgi:hypothetical protein